METVTGSLDGHKGSFQLMQMGTMEAGKLTPEGKPVPPELRAVVVPGSGTGALKGLTGTLRIDNNAGKHTYTLGLHSAIAWPPTLPIIPIGSAKRRLESSAAVPLSTKKAGAASRRHPPIHHETCDAQGIFRHHSLMNAWKTGRNLWSLPIVTW